MADTPVEFDGVAIDVTASIGVAGYRDRESIEDLLARADRRLYRAKAAGRNRVVTGAADSEPRDGHSLTASRPS